MSTPKFTHSVTGQKLSNGWTTPQALQLLDPIVTLTNQAAADQNLYLLTEA